MLVRSEERAPIARLLAFLEEGERMAEWCARAQAGLAPERKSASFLIGQSRQEAMHARVFHGAILWLAPKQRVASPWLAPMEDYRALLQDAVHRRDYLETILAEQIILEGLGEAILSRIEAGLAKRGAPFGRLRRVLLHQEEAHHGFGLRVLDRAISAGNTSVECLRRRAEPYLGLIGPMVTTLRELFDDVHEDAAAWAADAQAFLPSWLRDIPIPDPVASNDLSVFSLDAAPLLTPHPLPLTS